MAMQKRKLSESTVGLPKIKRHQSSGEIAKFSGFYRLDHPDHAREKEILVIKGTPLPFCPDCGQAIDFVLNRKIDHIDEDPDFRQQ